ncbi:SAM-dependent methyltransferase [Thermomonospora cellulosilytica]|uniref:SAM-dependent methyltransferase n=1 Tax=Thermomonospora cellulosilytica TaxID=1411118 RepID=A0A7W3RA81_9ACTN|nr:SAM-dependent methyltransferase [Thermomonospora cellulosilytica]MBA9005459.1 SAM-dependent methyltransferase [Thermomonospora cellulosilytica]
MTSRVPITRSKPAPDGVDANTPNAARMYDYWLGGKDNFAVDREAAEKVMAISSTPGVVRDVRAHRAFLGRAVRFLARQGVDQYLDIGTGLPTQDNVHQVAHRVVPDARVVYVDYDPVVCAHGRALLAVDERVRFVRGDLRRPREILDHPEVTRTLDFSRPVAVLLTGVLHHLTDEDRPHEAVALIADALAPGSHIVVSQVSSEPGPDRIARAADVFEEATARLVPRSRAEILRFFDGFELLEPGLVNVPAWRPVDPRDAVDAHIYATLAGIGRKPAA